MTGNVPEPTKPLKKPEVPRQENSNLLKGNPGNKGGHPTKYEDWMVDKVSEYCKEIYAGKRKAFFNECLPTLEGYALKIGVDADTVTNWSEAKDKDSNLLHPEFFGAIKRLKHLQRNQLITDGMYNKNVNQAMAIFLLKANHGMKDRIDLSSNDKELKGLTSIGVVSYDKDKK